MFLGAVVGALRPLVDERLDKALVAVLRHLLVGDLEELERRLLEVRDGALDLLGVHLVLVGMPSRRRSWSSSY